MKQFLFAVTSLLILSSASYGQSKWWVSADSVNIFTRNTGGVMIGGVDPLGKLTVNSDRLGFNLALVGDYNNLTKNYLKIGVLGRASNGLDGHTLFDLYHSNGTLKKAGFNFRINEKSAFFINGEGNIGIGTEKPQAGLDITSGPDWGGFRKGLRLSANNAISVESGEMKYGMVGSENALHFFATNGGEKVNPFGCAFARLMSLQPKKVVIEGDLEVKGKIIYEGGQFSGSVNTNTGGNTTGAGTADDGGTKDDGGAKGGGFGEAFGEDTLYWKRYSDSIYFNSNYKRLSVGLGTGLNSVLSIKSLGNNSTTSAMNILNSSNTSMLFVRDDGNVGIATASPSYKLDVIGTTRFSGASIFQSGDITFPGTGIWKSTGNLGLGTTTPGSKLEINGGPTWLGSYNKSITLNSNNSMNFISTSAQSTHFGIAGNSSSKKLEFFRPKWEQFDGWIVQTLMSLDSAGRLALGTTNPDTFKLAVNGSVKARAFVATTSGWADFVFADDYKLMPLNQLERYVKTHKHLPSIPTEKDVMSHGVNVGDVQAKLLQKVEELTLYLIEQNKKIEAQQKDIEQLKQENKQYKESKRKR